MIIERVRQTLVWLVRLCREKMVISLLLPFFLTIIVIGGCRGTGSDSDVTERDPVFLTINDTMVPVFSTAEEQLNYTRSWFARIQEKRAALEAFMQLYPMEKKECGFAALELAYLQLGNDYRLAHAYEAFAAIGAYRKILTTNNQFPDIMAKAHWYMGWIYLELLQDREKGMEEYGAVVNGYPLEQIILVPPAPWVSLIYHEEETVKAGISSRPVNHWAALALVEMIRYAADEEEARSAFTILMGKYRDNLAFGFGLRLMLARRWHNELVLKTAKEYMEKEFSNVHILGDIQKELNAITLEEGGSVQ